MQTEGRHMRNSLDRGVVILSIDTEQRWGYLDLLNEAQFDARYPGALGAHERLLAALRAADVRATWFLVGGMSLRGSRGARDRRLSGLPADWIAGIPAGTESTLPLWYRQSFVDQLRAASPAQEIGLHGGLTHFIWTDPRATREVVEWELAEGLRALAQAHVRPLSFSFGREQEAHHELLNRHGIRSYRGRTVSLAHRLGPALPGKLLRAANELARATPPLVFPHETLPGLWNIPSSLFLYPLGAARSRIIGPRSRVERFTRGVRAAVRNRGIFHFCLHPENLAESPGGYSMFDDILECLVQFRSRGDIEILTMCEVAARMEHSRESGGESGSSPTASRAGVSTGGAEPAWGSESTQE